MTIERLEAAGYPFDVYIPGDYDGRVLYCCFSADEVGELYKKPALKGLSVVSVDGIDWNRDMSPWPAAGVFREGGDFTGGADAFLDKLASYIIPAAEGRLPSPPDCRAVAGYSLGGLFAVYAGFRTELFTRAASMSGSLWYDGWLDYIREQPCHLERAYFSVGAREKNTRNRRMAAVESATRETATYLAERGLETVFELNPGNHFVDVGARIARGVEWLMKK